MVEEPKRKQQKKTMDPPWEKGVGKRPAASAATEDQEQFTHEQFQNSPSIVTSKIQNGLGE